METKPAYNCLHGNGSTNRGERRHGEKRGVALAARALYMKAPNSVSLVVCSITKDEGVRAYSKQLERRGKWNPSPPFLLRPSFVDLRRRFCARRRLARHSKIAQKRPFFPYCSWLTRHCAQLVRQSIACAGALPEPGRPRQQRHSRAGNDAPAVFPEQMESTDNFSGLLRISEKSRALASCQLETYIAFGSRGTTNWAGPGLKTIG